MKAKSWFTWSTKEITPGFLVYFGIAALIAIWFKVKLHTAIFILTMCIFGGALLFIKVGEIGLRKQQRERGKRKEPPKNNSAKRRLRKKMEKKNNGPNPNRSVLEK
jgi:hypothetical protein